MAYTITNISGEDIDLELTLGNGTKIVKTWLSGDSIRGVSSEAYLNLTRKFPPGVFKSVWSNPVVEKVGKVRWLEEGF